VRVLVTNDDGIGSAGLQALAARLARDHELIVVAPARDMSGASAAIGRLDLHGIAVTPVTLPEVEDGPCYSLDGPPGLAVMAARLGAFGQPPDVVVSGINAGLNTGHSILHSGTVGAALTAQSFGSSAVAVSLAPGASWHWATAAEFAALTLEWVERVAPVRTVLNLNVPGVPIDEVRDLRWARLDRFGLVRAAVADTEHGRLQVQFRSGEVEPDPGRDTALVGAGHATLTALSGVGEASFGTELPGSASVVRTVERDVPPRRFEVPRAPVRDPVARAAR
jgi:5'-nucleotidase